jgi:hypothetical protein
MQQSGAAANRMSECDGVTGKIFRTRTLAKKAFKKMQISRARGGKGKMAKKLAKCGRGRARLQVLLKLKQEIGISLTKLNVNLFEIGRKWLIIQIKRRFGASSHICGPGFDGADAPAAGGL